MPKIETPEKRRIVWADGLPTSLEPATVWAAGYLAECSCGETEILGVFSTEEEARYIFRGCPGIVFLPVPLDPGVSVRPPRTEPRKVIPQEGNWESVLYLRDGALPGTDPVPASIELCHRGETSGVPVAFDQFAATVWLPWTETVFLEPGPYDLVAKWADGESEVISGWRVKRAVYGVDRPRVQGLQWHASWQGGMVVKRNEPVAS